jgi:hypothetical protein
MPRMEELPEGFFMRPAGSRSPPAVGRIAAIANLQFCVW